jgi:DNA-binding protein H-NS
MTIDLKSLSKNQLIDLINEAEQRRVEVEKEHQLRVRNEILMILKTEGYTLEQLFFKTNKTLLPVVSKSGRTRRPAPPKYCNPNDTAQVWSGRGKYPRWFREALESGKKRHDLLIK